MARGNSKNLKPRTQEGLQAALEASLTAGKDGCVLEWPAAVRKAMMKHGYMAKVVFQDPLMVATSGTLRAEAVYSIAE